MRRLSLRQERWPIAGAFTIARGSKTHAHVVVAEITDGAVVGRGEATPYARYGETVDGALDAMASVRDAVEGGAGRAALQAALPPGAARNALDCALWDLKAKAAGVRAWTLAGIDAPAPVATAYTLSVGAPGAMAAGAREAADRPLLKLKLGGGEDLARVEAVREAAPRARLIVDANEALAFDDLPRLAADLKRLGVQAIEQPLAAGADAVLEGFASPVPLYADESIHTRTELATVRRRYQGVNLKLDKAGGLTEALALRRAAAAAGLDVMVGCMVATSLAMAPAMLLTPGAAFVDLDGPLLLAEDRAPGLAFAGSIVHPPDAALWG